MYGGPGGVGTHQCSFEQVRRAVSVNRAEHITRRGRLRSGNGAVNGLNHSVPHGPHKPVHSQSALCSR